MRCIIVGMILVLLSAAVFAATPTTAADPRVRIVTEWGDIEVEIFASAAPVTAANFLRYVDAHKYDHTTFFRTVTMANQPHDPIRIEVVQGGDVADGQSFPSIAHEPTSHTGLRHLDGTISMARGAPGTASASFFFCIGPQPELDCGGRRNPDRQGFAAFGRVVSGLDVLRRIHRAPATGQTLTPPVRILRVQRI